MDLGIPGWCCSGQIMVGEREMKDQGWTWGFLEGVAVDRPWWGKEDEGTGMDLGIPGGCCRTDHGGGKRDEGTWTWGFLEGVA